LFSDFTDSQRRYKFPAIMFQNTVFCEFVFFFRFLMEIIDLIEKDIDVEGIFRRSGSVAKLKELRVSNCLLLILNSCS